MSQHTNSFITRFMNEWENRGDDYIRENCDTCIHFVKKILCWIVVFVLVTFVTCAEGFKYWGIYMVYQWFEKNYNKKGYAVNMLMITVFIDVICNIQKLYKKKKR
jgi:ABC-type phosphate transport system permease subunit